MTALSGLRVSKLKKDFSIPAAHSCISQQGFTLLELMISIALIVVIVVIVGGAMRLGSRSVSSGEKRMEALERLRTSFNMVDSQVQSQVPMTYTEDAVNKFYFKGERTYLQFATNYSIWLGQGGYVRAAYRVEADNYGKQALLVSENIIGQEASRETKLFDAFDNIYFDYFVKEPTEEKGKWTEQWTDEKNLPEKVRLHLIDGQKELALIIPLRARGTL